MAKEKLINSTKHDLAYVIRKNLRIINNITEHLNKLEVKVEITKGKENKFIAVITEEI